MNNFLSKQCRGLRKEVGVKVDEEVSKDEELGPIDGKLLSTVARPFIAGRCLVKSVSGQCYNKCFFEEALKE